jgi:hypothetical protein
MLNSWILHSGSGATIMPKEEYPKKEEESEWAVFFSRNNPAHICRSNVDTNITTMP